jgi:Xaa-Pro aminopeptidase
MWPTPTPSTAFAPRRAHVCEQLGSTPALIAAGSPQARNYPANRYPFRASSHFLYLVGRPLAGALLWLSDGQATLFVPVASDDDAMWHGPQPEGDQLAHELGLPVRSLGELPALLANAGAKHPTQRIATTSPNEDVTALLLSELLGRRVAVRSGAHLAEGTPDARLADALIVARLQHDQAAQAQLRQAADVTARAHAVGLLRARPNVREAELAAAMLAAMGASGMGPSYEPIVTTHGEVLHNPRYDHVLASGDLLLADVGAETPEGFAGDVTRVWPIGGRFSPTQRALYEVVLRAQQLAIGMVTVGTRYRAVHQAAARALIEGLCELGILRGDLDDLVESGAHAPFFPHGVGHLIGADVHDMEDLGDRAGYARGRARSARFGDKYLRLDRDLSVGMAVTIEPGFYQIPAMLMDRTFMTPYERFLDRDVLAQFHDVRGIRIEDDVLVTEQAPEVLSASIPKQVSEIEELMRQASSAQ